MKHGQAIYFEEPLHLLFLFSEDYDFVFLAFFSPSNKIQLSFYQKDRFSKQLSNSFLQFPCF